MAAYPIQPRERNGFAIGESTSDVAIRRTFQVAVSHGESGRHLRLRPAELLSERAAYLRQSTGARAEVSQ